MGQVIIMSMRERNEICVTKDDVKFAKINHAAIDLFSNDAWRLMDLFI